MTGFRHPGTVLTDLLEDPFAGDELSDAFLYAMMNELSFANGPLYALLHEAAYAQGLATRWSAQRIRAAWPAATSKRFLS
jgi:hypothetical protein